MTGLEWARVGMLEALKARNIIYRMILAYYLWISRFKSNTQWGLIIGAFVGIRIVRAIAITVPALAPFLSPTVTLYITFSSSLWVVSYLTSRIGRDDASISDRLLIGRYKKVFEMQNL